MDRKILCGLSIVVALFVQSSVARTHGAIQFAAHRAIYDVSLDRTTPGSSVAALDGRLVYEITGSTCEGYTQNMRFVTRTSDQEGATQTTDLRTSSWEDGSAHRLRFSTANYQNHVVAEQTQGDAERNDAGSSATVSLLKPSKKSAEIPAGVYFPVQHSIALIEAARAGRHMFVADIYDGSETGEKVYATSAAIGAMASPGAIRLPALATNGDKLSMVPSWPVSISYYEGQGGKKDITPSYEMAYRLHENGVTSELVIDHREFAFRAEIKELEFLPQVPCGASQP